MTLISTLQKSVLQLNFKTQPQWDHTHDIRGKQRGNCMCVHVSVCEWLVSCKSLECGLTATVYLGVSPTETYCTWWSTILWSEGRTTVWVVRQRLNTSLCHCHHASFHWLKKRVGCCLFCSFHLIPSDPQTVHTTTPEKPCHASLGNSAFVLPSSLSVRDDYRHTKTPLLILTSLCHPFWLTDL